MGKEKKYVSYVEQSQKDKSAKEKAKEVQPILLAKLRAKMASLDAQIMEKEAKVKGLELEVEVAYGYVTTDIDAYVSTILNAKHKLKQLEDEIEELEELKEDLIDIMTILD